MHTVLFAAAAMSIASAAAHIAPFHVGMYCQNGSSGSDNQNTAEIVRPLYMLPKSQWWLHHMDNCDQFPPKDGDFLELPAGGQFMVEHAMNRAETSLSYDGRLISAWPDGKHYPEDYNVPSCITRPNIHAQNESMAAGTAFAISYTSNLEEVTPENLVVFTVKHHTPWKRVAMYDVPAAMPACPPGGCICAWGWIPNGCGEPNMYQVPYRCRVTGATSVAPIAQGVPPVWCEGSPDDCVPGAKQMLYWHQQDGNNIDVTGLDMSSHHKSPAYNAKCGFQDGAQNDIFVPFVFGDDRAAAPGTLTRTGSVAARTPHNVKLDERANSTSSVPGAGNHHILRASGRNRCVEGCSDLSPWRLTKRLSLPRRHWSSRHMP